LADFSTACCAWKPTTASEAARVSSASGRLDYIKIVGQWRKRFAAPSLNNRLLKLQLLPSWLTSADFRLAFTAGVSANSVCFERELLDHYRLIVEEAG
jgi:cyclopropane-fatty-acyl-phospholipid synthase